LKSLPICKKILNYFFDSPRSKYQTEEKIIVNTPLEFQLDMFKQFPEDLCQLIFNDYIHLSTTPQESIYITVITSILEGKTDPNNIFTRQFRCQQDFTYCFEPNSNSCCYSYVVQELSPVQIFPKIYINFVNFKNFSLDDLMNVFVKDKI
jgi:hypothetical protein